MLGIYRVAAQLAASRVVLSSTLLVSYCYAFCCSYLCCYLCLQANCIDQHKIAVSFVSFHVRIISTALYPLAGINNCFEYA
jgi:hypothetical protein